MSDRTKIAILVVYGLLSASAAVWVGSLVKNMNESKLQALILILAVLVLFVCGVLRVMLNEQGWGSSGPDMS